MKPTTLFQSLVTLALAVPASVMGAPLLLNGTIAGSGSSSGVPGPLSTGHPGTPGVVKVERVHNMGSVLADNTYAIRDGGGVGMLAGKYVITYGDTLFAYSNLEPLPGALVSSSVAWADPHNPTRVNFKLSGEYPAQFGPLLEKYNETGPNSLGPYAMAASNIQPTTGDEGVVYLVKNFRPGGVDHIIGSAPARVTVVDGYPKATRIMDTYWNGTTEPMYGSMNVVTVNAPDGAWLYAFGVCQYGGCQAYQSNNINVYVTRVRPAEALDVTKYQYWNGKAWQNERLINPTDTEAINGWWGIGNGGIFYHDTYKKWIFLYNDDFVDNQIQMRTADNVMGPWSDSTVVYQATPPDTPGFHNAYATSVNLMYDPSMKTVVVTYCMAPNDIIAIRLHFNC